jgi:DNA-binding NarL/FixJ family response regulator
MTTSQPAPIRELLPAKSETARVVASPSLLAREALSALRISAIARDALPSADASLAQLWSDLASGRYRIVDDFFSDDRCYLVLAARADAAQHAIEGRRLEILQAVLSGLPQKNVACDLDLAPSTIALNSRLALEALGVSCKASRAHPLLMLAARAANETRPATVKCSSFIGGDERELRVLGAPRPDRHLTRVLPSAELAVIRRLVEGLSYVQIARERGTSTRTIANQITAVFRRLRVSGRNELVQRLFWDESLLQHLSSRTTGTFLRQSPRETTPPWSVERRSA